MNQNLFAVHSHDIGDKVYIVLINILSYTEEFEVTLNLWTLSINFEEVFTNRKNTMCEGDGNENFVWA